MKWSDLATRGLCSYSYNISINASDLIRRNSAYMISNMIIATSHCLICIQPLPSIILAGLISHGGDNDPLKQPCIHTRINVSLLNVPDKGIIALAHPGFGSLHESSPRY